MPAHDRVGRHDGRNAIQQPSAELLAPRCEAPTLVIVQSKLATLELLLEDAVLLDEVLDGPLLLARCGLPDFDDVVAASSCEAGAVSLPGNPKHMATVALECAKPGAVGKAEDFGCAVGRSRGQLAAIPSKGQARHRVGVRVLKCPQQAAAGRIPEFDFARPAGKATS